MGRADREKKIQDLHELFSRLEMAVLTDYRGMSVEALTTLRSKLREVDARFRVVKNTLSIRAADGTPLESIKEHFTGPVAILYTSSENPVAPAKTLMDFVKKSEHLKPRIGVLSGKAIDLADFKRLADMPSKDTMIAQTLSSMSAPAANFVRTLSEVTGGFIKVLGAIQRRKEAA